MKISYLLDTNVLSEPLRPRPNVRVMERLQAHDGQLATATPVWHELLFACRRLPKSTKRQAIETYLHTVVRTTIPILSYDLAAAEWHAQERARLSRRGKPPSYADGQIAAIAKVNELVLVTSNVKDYAPFRDLNVENWED